MTHFQDNAGRWTHSYNLKLNEFGLSSPSECLPCPLSMKLFLDLCSHGAGWSLQLGGLPAMSTHA